MTVHTYIHMTYMCTAVRNLKNKYQVRTVLKYPVVMHKQNL